MNQRVEAAAKAAHEFDNSHCPSFTWESAAEGWRKADRERQAAALAAADAVMFSDEAVERAAVALWNHDFPSHPIDNVAELLEWTRGRRLEQARAVIAALKGDA